MHVHATEHAIIRKTIINKNDMHRIYIQDSSAEATKTESIGVMIFPHIMKWSIRDSSGSPGIKSFAKA